MLASVGLAAALCAGPSPGEFAGESAGESMGGPRLVDALPDHARYQRPVWFGAIPALAGSTAGSTEGSSEGASRRHVVAEQGGRVYAFALDARGVAGPRAIYADLSGRVSRVGNEEGLLGIAFHPRFASNGRVFVHYSVRGEQRGRLSELRASPPSAAALDLASERVLLEIEQPYRNHNGGEIAFGPDGMLYFGLGDGGSAGDPHQNGQDLGTLLGKILRLDVDRADPGRAYAVPADNPFVGRAGARGEIWAFGLRNPWRFSFDGATGKLWCGDVGQLLWEEIDVIERGGNYGWRAFEGPSRYDESARAGPGPMIAPVHAYPRRDGWSVTGGFVYRGERVSELAGRYVFADYVSGRIWSIAADPKAPGEPRQLATCDGPASFGLDARGELYVCCFDGRVRRIE